MARAVKSEEELIEIRDSMDIIHEGFWALLEGFAPGKTEAEIMAPAVEVFFARGAGPRMMNIVLSGENGEAEAHFKVPGHRRVGERDLMLYSLEIAGAGGYWVEFSRALIAGEPSKRTLQMAEVYPEAMEAARKLMRDGVLACDVHKVVADTFARQRICAGTSIRTFHWYDDDRASGNRREESDRAQEEHDFFFASTSCRSRWKGLPLHPGYLSRGRIRGRKPE